MGTRASTRAATRLHPDPGGRTRDQNRSSVSGRVGAVMNVTTSHVAVANAIVIASRVPKCSSGSPFTIAIDSSVETCQPIRSDAAIAAISDHAFTRHQYHRRTSTAAEPDIITARNL